MMKVSSNTQASINLNNYVFSHDFYVVLSYFILFLFVFGVSFYFFYNLKRSTKILDAINKKIRKFDRAN